MKKILTIKEEKGDSITFGDNSVAWIVLENVS
jgi:hypothetical protein